MSSTGELASQSYFDTLPESLYLEIFQYLSATDLIRIQRVNKRWNRLSCDYYLWKTVRITPQPITKQALSKLVHRFFTEATTSVDVCGAWRWKDTNKTVSLSNHVLSLIAKNSPKLREFKVEEDNLKEVDLSLLPSSIQRFSFTNCEIPTQCLESIKGNFPKLRSLLFRRCPILQDKHLAAFGKLEYLEKLELYGCYRIDSAAIEVICNNYPNLTTLVLIGCVYLGDRDCRTISEKLPKLAVMEIEEWRDITMDGVTALRKKLKKLKFLSIKCRSINEGRIIIEGSRVHI